MPTATKDLENLVNQAKQATEGLDAELRMVAFERVLDHLLGVATNHRTGGSSNTNARSGKDTEAADGVFASQQQRIDALARYFHIEAEEVPHIFDTADDEPRLSIPSSRLAKAKSSATREIVLLVAGALTALGIDTTTSKIRSVVEAYGKLDRSNYMATLTNLDEISVLGRPRSINRIVRMKVIGAEAARGIAQRIVR